MCGDGAEGTVPSPGWGAQRRNRGPQMLKPVGMFPQPSPLTPSPVRRSGPGEPNVPVSEEIPPAFVYRDEEPLVGSRRKYLRIIPDQPRTKVRAPSPSRHERQPFTHGRGLAGRGGREEGGGEHFSH